MLAKKTAPLERWALRPVIAGGDQPVHVHPKELTVPEQSNGVLMRRDQIAGTDRVAIDRKDDRCAGLSAQIAQGDRVATIWPKERGVLPANRDCLGPGDRGFLQNNLGSVIGKPGEVEPRIGADPKLPLAAHRHRVKVKNIVTGRAVEVIFNLPSLRKPFQPVGVFIKITDPDLVRLVDEHVLHRVADRKGGEVLCQIR